MSMSTHVVGFRPPDERFRQMMGIYQQCKAAKIQVPEEVWEFFGGNHPDENGMEVEIKEAVREWSADMSDGLEVDLTKLPKGLTVLRFFNSY